MKLNLGCGLDYQENFTNIDNRDDIKVDLICDISKLPHGDGVADEILADDVLEHFSYRDTEKVLKEWVRTLKPNGKITIMVPNFNKICNDYVKGVTTSRRAVELLFGGQTYAGNFHYNSFDKKLITDLFTNCNLKLLSIKELHNNIVAIGVKNG